MPVIAVILAVLSLPAFSEYREKVLDKITSGFVVDEAGDGYVTAGSNSSQEQFKATFREKITAFAGNLGTVSVFGFLLLIVTAGLLFNTISNAFNAIWRVSSTRPFFNRIAIATNIIFWGPVMLAVSIAIGEYLHYLPFLGTFLIPTLFTTGGLTAFYMVMPHAKVRFNCALAGGVMAAVLWEAAKLLFLIYVTRVVTYSQVYGSLGLIPMLFFWVYINWVVILAGAELAYCLQHHGAMLEQWKTTQREAQALADLDLVHPPPTAVLATAIEIARIFQDPKCRGVRPSQLAQALEIETGLARRAANWLAAAGILVRVDAANSDAESQAEDPAFVPACAPGSCGVAVLFAATFGDHQAKGHGPSWDKAKSLVEAVSKLETAQLSKLTLADLAKVEAKPEAGAPAIPKAVRT